MKGQITIEYLISFIIFVGLIAYTYLSYSSNIPMFTEEVRKEVIRSEAYQLSELIVNNPGEPENWESTSIKRIGLLDERFNKTNFISEDKIDKLKNYFDCNYPANYSYIMSKLKSNRNFSFIIFEIDLINGNRINHYICNAPTVYSSINLTIQRIATYNDSGVIKLAEIIIQM